MAVEYAGIVNHLLNYGFTGERVYYRSGVSILIKLVDRQFQTGSLLNDKRIPWMFVVTSFVGKETPVLYFSILAFG